MLQRVESKSIAPSIVSSAKSCGNEPVELRDILALVRVIVPKPRGKWLERVTGAAPRTAEYWLQGKHEPRGRDVLAIVGALRAELEAHSHTLQQFELDLH